MNDVTIIAEAGVNHNGSLELAKELARSAKKCGADIVKYQTFNVDELVSKKAKLAKYQKENLGVIVNEKEDSQKEMLKKLTLTNDEFVELKKYCDEIGIYFLSTPFDISSVEFLSKLGCSTWKIPSGEITNYPYLKEIAKTGKKVILSTGMCTLKEVQEAYDLLRQNGTTNITLLHCTTNYPTPLEDVNLNAMITLREVFKCKVGYSDHTEGIEVPIIAVSMGAKIIEKHFTLDRNMNGPDHKASLEPKEFKEMVDRIRRVNVIVGDGIKQPTKEEIDNIKVVRKSIIAAKPIKKGEIFTEDNITTKRPGTGISPMKWNEVLGTVAIRDFEEDELIEADI